ncbi:DUF192 domain-containing protein [Paraburkholderia bonniea]|uniref:DUF192 domain-containing protein n=1 Tax=Paraburkholderia bonniea TaxID=2152891 RepID=UPI0012914614|nr:DUF192 domain-containing protein [Paraburkholderia bonniea]WJF91767.1 DUF192 domain-containing protein [Paraburkholderia bonniea]WJF95087.1 DUF192 domain-containing protein [Paraburkholderia bonniea]
MKLARLIIRQRDTGVRVATTETRQERMRGLLGRDHLPHEEALLLHPCRSIHTFGMRFAIDILFLDRYQRVVSIHHEVPSNRMRLHLRAVQTLEMRAGVARSHGISVGDQLGFEAIQ